MNLTIEEIIQKIPALKVWAKNPDIVFQLYSELNPRNNLTDVAEGDYLQGADVLVSKVMSANSYIGCPVCYTKTKDGVEEGVSYECGNAKCNTQRVATKLSKWKLLAGDMDGTKVVLDFPPFGFKIVDGKDYIAKVVNIKGKVTTIQEEKKDGQTIRIPVILVRDMKVLSDIRDTPLPTVAEGASVPTEPPTPVSPIPPPPSPPTGLPEDKLKTFNLWMTFQAKPIIEAQLVSYVENNLKLKLTDVLPLLDKTFQDATQTTLYTLKSTKPNPMGI